MTFLGQLGLMDMGDLLELPKCLSKIGTKVFEDLWFKLRTSNSSTLSSINTHLGLEPKLSTGRTSFAPAFFATYVYKFMLFQKVFVEACKSYS